MERWCEYRYRRIVPMTHDEFLSEPMEVVEWTLRLDDLRLEAEVELQERAFAKSK